MGELELVFDAGESKAGRQAESEYLIISVQDDGVMQSETSFQ